MDNLDHVTSCIKPGLASVISLIQITDTHILDEGASSFNDYDTGASLARVINVVKQQGNIDLMLITGDLVHAPMHTAYQKLADSLIGMTHPIYYLPGNHDEPAMMDYVMGANGFDPNRLINIGDWLIILLDSHLKGEHKGHLDSDELVFLNAALGNFQDKHILIAVHHHPVSINSPWMDAMILDNAGDFFQITDRYKNVRGIIWGHIHQVFETSRHHVLLYGTPSTCLQFAPESHVFAVDDKPPAYRKLSLMADGTINTEVVYC